MSSDSRIADPSLAPEGERKIAFVSEWMPVLNRVRDRLVEEGSVRGQRLAVILPVEPKTAYLAAVLAEAGADVTVAFQGVMVHDDVAAGLAERGVTVFAKHGSTQEEEHEFFDAVLARRPEVVIDDRADVIRLAHTTHPEILDSLRGASEETTSGVVALRAMEADGTLKVPCIAANDARCKYLFDNRYGSGQSAVMAVLDSTNLLMAGKRFVCVGYGWVGKGIAKRARGMGADVTVCEVEPFAALEAHHDGFAVLPLVEACASAELLITATGVRGALGEEALDALPDGAIIANAGGIDDEFSIPALTERASEVRSARTNVDEYVVDGRSIFVVGKGVCVNLSAGEGHPAEIMDLTFSVQALSARYLMLNGPSLEPRVYTLPSEIDEEIARMKLETLGLRIDTLSAAQQQFLQAWEAFA
jgi:adenosylhomocysteinase